MYVWPVVQSKTPLLEGHNPCSTFCFLEGHLQPTPRCTGSGFLTRKDVEITLGGGHNVVPDCQQASAQTAQHKGENGERVLDVTNEANCRLASQLATQPASQLASLVFSSTFLDISRKEKGVNAAVTTQV